MTLHLRFFIFRHLAALSESSIYHCSIDNRRIEEKKKNAVVTVHLSKLVSSHLIPQIPRTAVLGGPSVKKIVNKTEKE